MVDMNLLEILSLVTISMTITLGSIDSLSAQSGADTGSCSASSSWLDVILITLNVLLVTFMIGKLACGKRCQCGKSPGDDQPDASLDESEEVEAGIRLRQNMLFSEDQLPTPVECDGIELTVSAARNVDADTQTRNREPDVTPDLPTAPLPENTNVKRTVKLPSTAAPVLDRNEINLPDEEEEDEDLESSAPPPSSLAMQTSEPDLPPDPPKSDRSDAEHVHSAELDLPTVLPCPPPSREGGKSPAGLCASALEDDHVLDSAAGPSKGWGRVASIVAKQQTSLKAAKFGPIAKTQRPNTAHVVTL
jgi:hypothetical protein